MGRTQPRLQVAFSWESQLDRTWGAGGLLGCRVRHREGTSQQLDRAGGGGGGPRTARSGGRAGNQREVRPGRPLGEDSELRCMFISVDSERDDGLGSRNQSGTRKQNECWAKG